MSFTHRFGNATPDDEYNLICDLCTVEKCDGYCSKLRAANWMDIYQQRAWNAEDQKP